MSKRQMKLYLTDIDDAISAVQSYTNGMKPRDLSEDRKTREAVILNFVVMGEAIKRLPPSAWFRASWPAKTQRLVSSFIFQDRAGTFAGGAVTESSFRSKNATT